MFYHPLPRNLEAALRDVTDPKPLVRMSAIRDLVPHADDARDRIVSALEIAMRDDVPMVRAHAAEALGDVCGKAALPALLVAVEDKNQLVRQKAIGALGELGDARAQQRLERALSDERPEVRFQAVIAYPRVCSSREHALSAVVAATRDDDDHVAHIAFRMAEELTEQEGGPLEGSVAMRARACLRHDSPRVRAVAAVILAAAGEDGADETLVGVIDGSVATDEQEDVAAAIEAASDRELDAARPALERRAFGGFLGFGRDPLRWHARVALARMGHPRARADILSELGSYSYESRTLAVSAAGRAGLREAQPRILEMKGRPDRAAPSAVEAALAQLEPSARSAK